MTAARVPSVDEMTEVHQALWNFRAKGSSCYLETPLEEDDYLPHFARLADALRTVRPLVDRMEGWPHRFCRSLRFLMEWFDEVTREWGWERLRDPEPLRSAYVAERKAWFQDSIVRPMLEIALAWQEGAVAVDDCPAYVDQLADRARALGYHPATSAEDLETRLTDAQGRRYTTPRFGRIYPSVGSVTVLGCPPSPELEERVQTAFSTIHNEMIFVAPDRNRAIQREIREVPEPSTQSVPVESKDSGISTDKPTVPVVLGGPNDEPIVRGRIKKRLTPGQYQVVKALLDAHPERLSGDTLARRSKTEGPVKMIDRLHRDEDWAAVLDKPGQAHGGYGIRDHD